MAHEGRSYMIQSFKWGKALALSISLTLIGKLFPEPQFPCRSLSVAPDAHRANAGSHVWVQ